MGDLGEDIYGFQASGIASEFGLKSLVVPKRLLRPKAKTASNDECVFISSYDVSESDILFYSGAATEAEKYPAPPAFAALETKRIDDQIGILRPYYHHRIAALIPPVPLPPPVQLLAPPPPVITAPLIVMAKTPTPEPTPPASQEPMNVSPPTPPPAPAPAPVFDPYNPSALSIVVPKLPVTPPPPIKQEPTPPNALLELASTGTPANMHHNLSNINTSVYNMDVKPYIPIVMELPAILEDDPPDPSRVRVGPLGQILMPSAATVAKQKRQHKAAQAKAAAAAAAAISASIPPATPTSAALQSPVSASKPKKTTPKKPKKPEAISVPV